VPGVAVHPQTALGYAVLLAVLVLVAWLVARMTGSPHGWWLPLAVATLGEPSLRGTAGKAVGGLATLLVATVPLLLLLETVDEFAVRAACAVALLSAILGLGRRYPWLQGFLLTPLLVLFAPSDSLAASGSMLQATLLASALVFMFAVLGKWMLWTLRPDAGRVHA
jgi:hypothetical protein